VQRPRRRAGHKAAPGGQCLRKRLLQPAGREGGSRPLSAGGVAEGERGHAVQEAPAACHRVRHARRASGGGQRGRRSCRPDNEPPTSREAPWPISRPTMREPERSDGAAGLPPGGGRRGAWAGRRCAREGSRSRRGGMVERPLVVQRPPRRHGGRRHGETSHRPAETPSVPRRERSDAVQRPRPFRPGPRGAAGRL
jgi:hypothetical protein